MQQVMGLTIPETFKGWPHVLEMQQFSREQLEFIWGIANRLNPKMHGTLLEGKRVAILFDKPSPRTYLSFHEAAERLGAKVTAFDNILSGSSVYKDEEIKSVLDLFVGGGYSLFVLRLPQALISRFVSISQVPVINGGWDDLQHPTQAILDAHAILRRWGSLDGIRLLFVGNANSRATRSLAYLLGKFKDISLTFATLTRPGYSLAPDLRTYLTEEHQVEVREVNPQPGELRHLAAEHDGIYVVRLHNKRDQADMSDGAKTHEALRFQITQAVVDALPENGFVHHPLPNTPLELTDEVIELNDSRQGGKVIAIQAMVESGIKTRQALYAYVLHFGV